MSGIGGPGAITGAAQRLQSLHQVEPQRGITLEPPAGAANKTDFADTLSGVLSEVNGLQQRADQLTEQFAAGEVQNLHEVVIAQQEAAIAFQLVQSVRDKLLQSYQELMRMQV